MPKTTIAGHPAHPQLVSFPLALFPFTLALDVLHVVTGERRFEEAARLSLTGAIAGAAVAGVAGALDYLEIPEEHATKPMARLHGGLNLGLVGLALVNLMSRRNRRRRSESLPALLSGVGTLGLFLSAWYGGHLVYAHGLRVEGRSPLEDVDELAPPGDAALARGLASLAGHRH
jgi:uncharacterized membrane protein